MVGIVFLYSMWLFIVAVMVLVAALIFRGGG
jgi:hypothetical protein